MACIRELRGPEILDSRGNPTLEVQVLFIPLCGRCAEGIEALGRPVERYDAKDAVIVA
jgi:enolase